MLPVLAGMLLSTLFFFLVSTGIGGCRKLEDEGKKGEEEGLVLKVIEDIIVPKAGSGDFLVEWRRLSTGPADVEPEELGMKFWRYQAGELQEITREEYLSLIERPGKRGSGTWAFSQHSITLLQLDWEKGEAVVEVGSLYNILSGQGVRHLLRREDGRWVKVSEETIWKS